MVVRQQAEALLRPRLVRCARRVVQVARRPLAEDRHPISTRAVANRPAVVSVRTSIRGVALVARRVARTLAVDSRVEAAVAEVVVIVAATRLVDSF